MNKSQAYRWLLVTGLLLVVATAVLWRMPRRAGAPDGGRADLPVIREVGAFTVTNQSWGRIEASQMRGRPWAVNLIFTRCPGPCAALTGVLRAIQDRLPPESAAGLMSVTSDPEFDTPDVLAAYAAKFGADTTRWQFVTASKEEIRRLATRQLLLVLEDKPEAERESPTDLFLHSTLIVLIDREGRLRGAVHGLEPGAADDVLAGLAALETERED
jgi:protein SCO1/2